MKKKIIYSVVVLLLIAGAWKGYRFFSRQSGERDILSVLPENAIYILKTNELTDAWKEVSETNIWKHFIRTKGFEYLQSVDTILNENLLNNATTRYIFKNRPTLMAAYMTGASSYDFVYVVDLQQVKYIKQFFDEILRLDSSHKLVKLKYKNTEIIKLIDKEQADNTIYLFSLDNLLVASFSYKLIQQIIDEKNRTHWIKRPDFVKINDKLEGELVQMYINYDQLPAYAGIYFKEASKDLLPVAQQLDLSGFDISHDNERIRIDGFTLTDSVPSYMNALLDVKPGKTKAHNIISNRTALYISLSFKNFNLFYQSLLDQYGASGKTKKDSYRNNVKKIEKFFKIDLQKDFFDWIGQEISLVKIRSYNRQKPEDVLMLIEAKDIDDAQAGMQHIATQIKKRSPFKFKAYTYKNFPVNYLHQKGFFKTILGDLFKKIDKPYYTFIEDYVVFSNSENVLKEFIDDYITGKTLSHDEAYMDFKDEFNAKSNVQMYIQMPKMFAILQQSLTAEGKKSLNEKKDLLLSFSRIGLQMTGKDDIFKTIIIIDHDEQAIEKEKADEEVRKIDKSIHNDFFEDLQFKIFFPDTLQVSDGMYRRYYADGKTIKTEGKVKDNLPQGIWRTYYESGNLQSVVNYDNGNVDGEMFYYFDKKPETKMVEANYEDDLLDGEYLEYWQNAAQKAKLHYKNAKLHGEALYFFPSGKLKIKGKYKNGKKKGKWLFYNEKGDVINKKRYSGIF